MKKGLIPALSLTIVATTSASIPVSLAAQTEMPRGGASAVPPPIHTAGARTALSGESFALVTNARALPGGMVLVNDAVKHRVLLMDSTLALVKVVVDSANNPANYYGARPGGLIAYRGDSTLFVDPGDLTMMVIDPKGNISRVMSVPRSQDAAALASTTAVPAFDGSGRLVYRSNTRLMMPSFGGAPSGAGAAAPTPPQQPDTTPLQRIDIASRKVDTAGYLKVPKPSMSVTQSAGGSIMMSSKMDPMPLIDEWAVLEDGTIAMVRGQDYHVDWITPDGKMSSSPKVPFEWQRLTDDAKVAVIDSVKKLNDAAVASGAPAGRVSGDVAPMVLGGGGGGGGQRMQINIGGASVGGGGGGAPMVFGPGSGMGMPQMEFVAPSELPDYRPAFSAGAARGDRDGNLWVRTSAVSKSGESGPIYDVINRKGQLIDRVQLAQGRSIVGFGPGGVLFLMARTDVGVQLERVKAR